MREVGKIGSGEESEEQRKKMEYYIELAREGDEEEEEEVVPQINITTIMKERLEKERQEIFKEGLSYAAELAYFVWIILTFATCSGMFIENPVQERLKKIRYYLHVLG
jgi:hypothetical protein